MLPLFLTFVMFMKLTLMIGCIHSTEVRCKDGRYGFEISWKHQRLVFVFSMENNTKLYYYISMFLVC